MSNHKIKRIKILMEKEKPEKKEPYIRNYSPMDYDEYKEKAKLRQRLNNKKSNEEKPVNEN